MKRFVYFLQSASGPIKIGFSTNPVLRISSLRTAAAENIRVLAVVDGDKAMEAALHQEFAAARIRNEWFQPTPGLLAKIADLQSVTTLKRRACEPDEFTRAAQYWVTRMEDDLAERRGTTVNDCRPELAAEAGLSPSTFENLRRGRVAALSASEYEAIRVLFIRRGEGVAAALRAEIASLVKLVGTFAPLAATRQLGLNNVRRPARASALVTILDSVNSEGAGERAQ